MTIARRDIIPDGAEGVYHCMTRCVRRAFLCGNDPYTGKSFEHRREWVQSRLKLLAGIFSIEIYAFAVMANHLHVILRTRPDQLDKWSDEEVAYRWLRLFPIRRNAGKVVPGQAESDAGLLARDASNIRIIRSRLGSVSWFMRCLNENIARRANKEDDCKGRFWEGRFKSQVILDESALLACMAYVDLNPVRAGEVPLPEDSPFTSAYLRIKANRAGKRLKAIRSEIEESNSNKHNTESYEVGSKAADWLCPFDDDKPNCGHKAFPITTEEYLSILDWTGRLMGETAKGRIPESMEPILNRLRVKKEHWLDVVENFGRMFYRAAGGTELMVSAARKSGRCWLKGIRAGMTVFYS